MQPADHVDLVLSLFIEICRVSSSFECVFFVRLQVRLQIVFADRSIRAPRTLVSFFARVNSHVSLEVVKSLDALVAKRTLDVHIFGIESFQLRFRFSDD